MPDRMRVGAGHIDIEPLAGSLVRLVEDQQKAATFAIIPDVAKQSRLEELIDNVKPGSDQDVDGLHYLLATPFRYPPLRHGSRFGTRSDRGIFYGSHTMETACHEVAYYLFLVRQNNENLRSSDIKITLSQTIFGVNYRTDTGVRLQSKALDAEQPQLTSPSSYEMTQAVGKKMRGLDVVAFEYRSAREPSGGLNVGIFKPNAFTESRPDFQRKCFSEVSDQLISILDVEYSRVYDFPVSVFTIDDVFPTPGA